MLTDLLCLCAIHVSVLHWMLYNVMWFGNCLSHDTYVQHITTYVHYKS